MFYYVFFRKKAVLTCPALICMSKKRRQRKNRCLRFQVYECLYLISHVSFVSRSSLKLWYFLLCFTSST